MIMSELVIHCLCIPNVFHPQSLVRIHQNLLRSVVNNQKKCQQPKKSRVLKVYTSDKSRIYQRIYLTAIIIKTTTFVKMMYLEKLNFGIKTILWLALNPPEPLL